MNTSVDNRLEKMAAAMKHLNRAMSPREYTSVWAGQDDQGNDLYTLLSPNGGVYARRNYVEFLHLVMNLTIAANGRGKY